MKIFDPDNHTLSARHKEIFAFYALAYTIVDFLAAALFVIGSILFFSASTTYVATWLFLVGSVLFGLRPTITLMRELAYMRLGEYDKIMSG